MYGHLVATITQNMKSLSGAGSRSVFSALSLEERLGVNRYVRQSLHFLWQRVLRISVEMALAKRAEENGWSPQ